MNTYIVEYEDQLDNFDTDQAWAQHGEHFFVFVEETQQWVAPQWCRRSNGDIDGLEGWNTV